MPSEDDARRRAPEHGWIDTPAGFVFVSYHPPAGDAPRGRAVVLCNPFGFEALCAHRTYRHLARALAKAGIPAVRFDYHGTGDSAGDDADPDRVAAWVTSVRAVASWVRHKSGASEVSLFATRFGALLAMEAARAGDLAGTPFESLVLLAPATTGRAWLRESRAFQAMKKRTSSPAGGEEIVGFFVATATAEAIGALDPVERPEGQIPARALVFARDDLPAGEGKLASKLESRGTVVSLIRTAGYGKMMQDDPYKSVVPEAILRDAVAWLATGAPPAGDSAEKVPELLREIVVRGADGVPVREEVAGMDGLFGIVSGPHEASRSLGHPAVILHTIGANHRIGSNRMYVGLARRFAARDVDVMRLDVSGMGDSPPRAGRGENEVYSTHARDDSRAAMDWLARVRRAERFVLMGLCSGAYVSFHAAIVDPRVVAVVLINILTFQWRAGDSLEQRSRNTYKSTRFYSQSVFDREMWERLLMGQVNAVGIGKTIARRVLVRARRRLSEAVTRESDVAQGFREILRRKANVLLLFSADDGGLDLVDEHLGTGGERFRHEPRFSMRILEGPDHTFTPLASQRDLFEILTSYLEGLVAPPPPRSSRWRMADEGKTEIAR